MKDPRPSQPAPGFVKLISAVLSAGAVGLPTSPLYRKQKKVWTLSTLFTPDWPVQPPDCPDSACFRH